MYIADCGDSMAVLCRNGVAVPLSTKHNLFSLQNIPAASRVKIEQVDGSEKSVATDFSDSAGASA